MSDLDGWGQTRNDDGQGNGLGALRNELKAIKAQLAALQRGAPGRASGIRYNDDGMIIDSSLDVVGDLDVSGDAAFSGNLDVSGDTEFSGDTVIGGNASITGTLSLPSGIIDNDALASPAEFRRAGGGEAGFVVPNGRALVAVNTITVPSGYTRALIMAVGSASAQNTAATVGYLYVGAQIGSELANRTYGQAAVSGYTNATGSATRLIEGLSGGESISIATTVEATNGPWTGPTSANTDGIAIFLR